MIGAARCSSSTSSPLADIISGRASTTTYVSAAANAIATAASPSSVRDASTGPDDGSDRASSIPSAELPESRTGQLPPVRAGASISIGSSEVARRTVYVTSVLPP